MNVSSFSSATSNIYKDPLQDESNITAFKTLEGVIRTCIGPHGKLKAVQNASGGLVTITSSSPRLFPIISIRNTLLKFVTSSTKAHLNSFNNSGLCCSLLTLKLINNSLSTSYSLPSIGKLIEYLGRLFIEHLNIDENLCIRTMDFSDLAYFQSVVFSILHSKPGCILRDEDKQHLCILLMKVYFNCLPSPPLSTTCYKNINFVTLESVSCDQSSLYEGLLIRLSDMSQNISNELFSISQIKIVLYTSSLSGDADFPVNTIEVTNDVNVWEAVLLNMKKIVEKLIKDGIHILACQKVVHPSLQKQLEDSNILVLDRLGFQTAKHLEFISGASNSSLFEEASFGYLTSINQITIGRKSFLLLSNEAKPLWTMLICNFNEQAVNETKVVCEQVIETLIRLLKKPFVCSGAGCTEIHTSKLVAQKVLHTLKDIQSDIRCKNSEILEALQIFQQSIVDLAVAFHQGSYLNVATEAVYGHLWKLKNGNFPSENDRCLCGLLPANLINSSDWEMFTKCTYHLPYTVDFVPVKANSKIDKYVILDELSSKVNAYSLAFETASLLLRVSLSVTN